LKKTVLFPGSFNPVHIGHLAIANYVTAYTDADELWLVLSPHNPHKAPAGLASFEHRYAMISIALSHTNLPVKVSDIEQRLPAPSYTINTLEALSAEYPDVEWTLLMGADNLVNFNKWKDYQKIISNYRLLAYPRLGVDVHELCKLHRATVIDAPIMEISSTFIRQAVENKRNVEAFLPTGVWNYIHGNKLY
jgi:nicotinate-nucleotide adenylyltransferase